MTHSRAAVEHPGPAGVTGTIGSAICLSDTVVERHRCLLSVTAVSVCPRPGNCSGPGVIVAVVAIGRGGETRVFPVAGRHHVIPGTGDEQHRQIRVVTLYPLWIQVIPVGQTDQWRNGPEKRRSRLILSQFPGKHTAVRTAHGVDSVLIDTQIFPDFANQGRDEFDVILLAMSP